MIVAFGPGIYVVGKLTRTIPIVALTGDLVAMGLRPALPGRAATSPA
jgi:hypothetical protein